jgi:hypothetical protein
MGPISKIGPIFIPTLSQTLTQISQIYPKLRFGIYWDKLIFQPFNNYLACRGLSLSKPGSAFDKLRLHLNRCTFLAIHWYNARVFLSGYW